MNKESHVIKIVFSNFLTVFILTVILYNSQSLYKNSVTNCGLKNGQLLLNESKYILMALFLKSIVKIINIKKNNHFSIVQK